MARSKKSPEDKPIPEKSEVIEDAVVVDQEASVSDDEASTEANADTNAALSEISDTLSPEDNASDDADLDEDEADEDNPVEDGASDADSSEEIASSETPVVPALAVEKKRSVVPALIGGALCVGLGYAGANFLKPEGWPFPGANTGAIEARFEKLEADLAAAQTRSADLTSELNASQSALSENLTAQIDAIDIAASVAPLQSALKDLSTRVTTVEAAPVAEAVVSPEATAAYERQLADMRALLDAEVARLTDAKIAAEHEEENAAKASAAARLQEAVATGMPFSDILANIEMDVPAALSQHAGAGVASLQVLADEFSSAADIAIVETAKIETPDQTLIDKFLRTQLGMRSLTPQDGMTPDAILSRAEQAIRDIDLQAALDEISTLPDVGQAALADWTARATSRLEVTTALSSMLAQ